MRKSVIIGGIAAACISIGAGTANAAQPPKIRPDVISQVCNQANTQAPGHCLQASGAGATLHMFAPNGQPNQEYNFFHPGTVTCGDNITDTNCPFPGVTPGQQIVVIGGQSAQNAGQCGGWTALQSAGTLVPCNGGTGTIAVLDGRSVESGLLGREHGGKVYLCENPANLPTYRTVWVQGDCQWSNLAQ
jgi:hypothetical protein